MITEDPVQITIPVLRLRQPIGEFFIGAVKASDLFRICYFDIRRIETESGIDTYLGIQRDLNQSRIREISQYVQTRDATFPTAVILAVDQRCAVITAANSTLISETEQEGADLTADEQLLAAPEMQEEAATPSEPARDEARFMMLTLRNVPNPSPGEQPVLFRQIARVLDGQHRIAGLEHYKGPDFEVNVSIFVGLDIATQASIFSVVNLAQTKVNRSLVYDLYSYDRARFPEKTCHEIAVALDASEKSPFHGMIKRLGVSTAGRFGQTLSQATFVEGLLPYISENIILDRDIGRRGMKWPAPSRADSRRMIFRSMFVDGRDIDIAAVVWAYFEAVKRKWPDAWNWTGSGRILNKTTGFNALMRFLRPAYLHFTQAGAIVSADQFSTLFEKVALTSDDFDTDTFKPGGSGTSKLFHTLLDQTGIDL